MPATAIMFSMKENASTSEYSVLEEYLHAATHGVGVILSILGLSWMLTLSISAGDSWRIVASSIYGASLIMLFLASTVYHGMHASKHRELFKMLDHCAIYLLIAGTYTPFLLVAMRGTAGWWMLGTVWVLATAGIIKKLVLKHRFPKLALATYLGMGWLAVIVLPQMTAAIGTGGMIWLIAGGLCYTVGAFFYAADRLPFNHTVWHVFVLGGGICHFLGIVRHVLPVSALA